MRAKSEVRNRTERKRKREQQVADKMIHLYCRRHHDDYDRHAGRLCVECSALSEYVRVRTEKCPFMENKTFCSNCKVHCYRPEMQEKIRRVMRFSGPRMIFFHPILAGWHIVCSIKEKRRNQEKQYD